MLVLTVAAVGVFLIARLAGGPPAEAGTDWNHADLLNHLNSRGMQLEMRSTAKHVYFIDVSQGRGNADDLGDILDQVIWDLGSGQLVVVEMYGNPKDAYDAVGVLGDNGFQWGRFTFKVKNRGKPLLTIIKSTLD